MPDTNANLNDFEVWKDGQTPVVNMSSNGEFDVWEKETPVEDRDVGLIITRRRVTEF